jgi:hypothetical protein
MKGDYLSGDATFLQRLFVGWTGSSGVKSVPFSEEERTNVYSQTIRGRLDARRASLPTDVIFDVDARSRSFLSHDLALVGFDSFTLPPCNWSSCGLGLHKAALRRGMLCSQSRPFCQPIRCSS